MLKSGDINPRPAKPARKANIPRPITTTPAVLKKSGAYFDLAKDIELNESRDKTGKVPSAKANIINDPEIKDPLAKATTCIA